MVLTSQRTAEHMVLESSRFKRLFRLVTTAGQTSDRESRREGLGVWPLSATTVSSQKGTLPVSQVALFSYT